MRVPQRRRRLPVLTYLLLAFGTAVAGIVTLLVSANLGDARRERQRVSADLRSAAEASVSELAASDRQVIEFMRPIAQQASGSGFDPGRCDDTFKGLGTLAAASGQLHLIGPDGKLVCSLGAGDLEAFDLGQWGFDLTSRQPQVGTSRLDPVNGRPAEPLLFPIATADGRSGFMAALLYLDTSHIELPRSLPTETALLELDPGRTVVLRASASAKSLIGRHLTGTGLEEALRPKGATIVGFDGKPRFAIEAGGDHGRTVVAMLPSSLVTAGARESLRENLTWGGLATLCILTLGLLLHRRLARPMRRITAAIRSASGGAEEVWAPVEGPAELGVMAEAFNEMLADRRSREADLRHRATHDGLTGLPNRSALIVQLSELLASDRPVALLFLDLDRFKLVNDSHGHNVGDSVLGVLGVRLGNAVRPGDTVARFGGDEFLVLCPDVGDEQTALDLARRLTVTLEDAFVVDGHELFLSGSVGAALGRPGDEPEDLLRAADTAMYTAKTRGRPGYAFFDEEMRNRSLRRLELEQELHSALERDELYLHYQPLFHAEDGRVSGAEALLRWDNGVKGPVSPAEFIPIAEETGLVVPIGEWVLHTACRQAAAWRQELGQGVRVSVNMAARQLSRPGLAALVSSALLSTGARPEDLMLEITEHGVLEDFAVAYRQLQEVRATGVAVSVDDFGTGWSSLSYLQRLPVDEMKIDRSFVATLGVDGASSAIVGSLVDMAHGLGLEVVAEGVETNEQLEELRKLGCDHIQGFLLARPGPADALVSMILPPAHVTKGC